MSSQVPQWLAPQLVKLEKAVNELPTRQYYMAFFLLLLVAIKFAFVPWLEEAKSKKVQLQQLVNTVKAPALMLQQMEKMQQALTEKRDLHTEWLSNFYQESESQVKVAVVNKLQKSAKDRGLLFLRSRWLSTPAKRMKEFTTIEPLLYSVLIRGDYNQIRELIQEWQTFKPFIQIEEITIRDRSDEGVVATTFKISVYRLKDVAANDGARN